MPHEITTQAAGLVARVFSLFEGAAQAELGRVEGAAAAVLLAERMSELARARLQREVDRTEGVKQWQ